MRALHEAVRAAERSLGGDSKEFADWLETAAAEWSRTSAFPVARPLYDRLVALREAQLAPDDPRLALIFSDQALLLFRLGAHAEARAALEKALPIYERVYGPDDLRVAVVRGNLARALVELSAHREARPHAEHALEVRTRRLGPDAEDTVASLECLAYVLYGLGEHAEAGSSCDRALAAVARTEGRESTWYVSLLRLRGLIFHAQGALAEARAADEEALAIHERVDSKNELRTASLLNNLALVLGDQGEAAAARPLLERALEIRERRRGPDHPDVATTLNNLASLLHELGARAEARALGERALAIRSKALGERHPDVATSLNNLARMLQDDGNHEEARPLYERALAIFEAVSGPNHAHVATLRSNLGMLRHEQAAFEEARVLLEEALVTRRDVLGEDHPDVATSLNNLALVLGKLGKDDEAHALLVQALDIRERSQGKDHPEVTTSLNNLAANLARRGARAEARTLYERALELEAKVLRDRFAALSPADRVRAPLVLRRTLGNWFALAPKVGTSGYPQVFRHKGVVSRANDAERRLGRGGGVPAERIEALREAEREVARLGRTVPSARGAPDARPRWRAQYAGDRPPRRARTGLGRRLRGLPSGARAVRPRPADVQARLGERDALVDFFRVDGRYLAFVLRHTGEATRVDLGPEAAIEGAAEAFAEAVARRRPEETVTAAGRALFDLVIARPGALGDDLERLVVCPDAAIAVVPLSALPGWRNGALLGDALRLAWVSSAQDLVPRGPPPRTSGALVVGAVDYARAADVEPGLASRPGPVPAAASVVPHREAFEALAGTDAEAKEVLGALGEGAVRLSGRGRHGSAGPSGGRGEAGPPPRDARVSVRDDLLRGLRGAADERLDPEVGRRLARGHDPMVLSGLRSPARTPATAEEATTASSPPSRRPTSTWTDARSPCCRPARRRSATPRRARAWSASCRPSAWRARAGSSGACGRWTTQGDPRADVGALCVVGPRGRGALRGRGAP